jgi:hypothetical protein
MYRDEARALAALPPSVGPAAYRLAMTRSV